MNFYSVVKLHKRLASYTDKLAFSLLNNDPRDVETAKIKVEHWKWKGGFFPLEMNIEVW